MTVELMAPAKNLEILKSACSCGANSVYIGLPKFNARQVQNNFNFEELTKAINYVHNCNKKVYLTLNTLIKESEISEAFSYIDISITAGIDAIIIQDVGLFSYLSSSNVPIIASTQMTILNHYGASLLNKLGFTRLVLARELNVEEIKSFVSSVPKIEHECFIHGGLCIAYSGQCGASTYFNKCASNRGLCKTPCWDIYSLYKDGEHIRSGYLIRPKDMCGLEKIPFLVDAGIKAFKLQGRTKSKEYVETLTSVYRETIDEYIGFSEISCLEHKIEKLEKISTRGLMIGNLDCAINTDYIVNINNPTVIKLSNDILNVHRSKCFKPKNITVFFNKLEYLNPSSLSKDIYRVYIPFDLFKEENIEKIDILSKRYPVFIVLPFISERAINVYGTIQKILKKYTVRGVAISTLSDLEWCISSNICHNYIIHAERTLNVGNHHSIEFFEKFGVNSITLPLELGESDISDLCIFANKNKLERIIYGKPTLMRMKYCVLSESNECPQRCNLCQNSAEYLLVGKNEYIISICKSRCETSLLAKHCLSLRVLEKDVSLLRIEFYNESTEDINHIIESYKQGYYFEGLKNECFSI